MIKRGSLLKVKSSFQNQLIWMVFTAVAIPTLIFGGSLYLLIARLSGPNASPSSHEVIVDVTRYAAILFPVSMALLLIWVFRGTERIVGPLDRMIRELDERVRGNKRGPILLRPGDRLLPLADKINALIEERDGLKKP